MRRKILIFLICLISVFSMNAAAGGEKAAAAVRFDTPVCVTVNGNYLAMDTEPFLYEGVTFVPIRFVSEALGADSVSWNTGQRKAVIRQGNTSIELPVGKKYAYVNGKKVAVSQGVQLVNDRTYVPVRFVSESLDCDVAWDSSSYTVEIDKPGITVPAYLIGDRGFTDDEIYWLSKIIHAESRGEPMNGKIAVGNVVLNRVEDRQFPNSIYEVIFDRQHGVQFSPVADGSIHQTPLGDSVIAAKRALRGEEEAGESLYFLNPRIASSSWIVNNRRYYKSIGSHDFYL